MFQLQTIHGENLGDWSPLKTAWRDGYFPMYSSLRSIYIAIDRGIYHRDMLMKMNPLTGKRSREIWVHLPSLAELNAARGYLPPLPAPRR